MAWVVELKFELVPTLLAGAPAPPGDWWYNPFAAPYEAGYPIKLLVAF